MDRAWWRMYSEEVRKGFAGERYTTAAGVAHVKRLTRGALGSAGNSGAAAIMLAAHFGAERIILLGYDCHKRGGSHHHGDHPKGLGNGWSLPKWPAQFQQIAKRLQAEVINCSPGTALMVFPRKPLTEALPLDHEDQGVFEVAL